MVILVSACYGPHVFRAPLSELVNLPFLLRSFSNYSIVDVWVPGVLVIFFTAHLPFCVLNVVRSRRSRNEAILPVFYEWMPIIVYSGACVAWLGSPYSIVLKDNHLVLFCVTQSFVFGRMTTKIILAHLTRQPFPYWTTLIVPLVLGAIFANAPIIGTSALSPALELAYLWAYLCLALVVYFRWAFLVINAICKYLRINCLTIPLEKQRQLAEQKVK